MHNGFYSHGSVTMPFYFTSPHSNNHRLLIVSGLHGDEASVIPLLTEYIQNNESLLPSFLFIPEMSPSALALNQRNNVGGHNLNRIFGTDIPDDEREAIEHVVSEHGPFDLVLSFHEDQEFLDTYFYDVGEKFYLLHLAKWRQHAQEIEIPLLNGLDDPNDDALGYHFTDGYNHDTAKKNNGMFEYWVLVEQLAKRSLTIEIPTAASPLQKKKLIESVFTHLALPAFQKKKTTMSYNDHNDIFTQAAA
jgi:hypothetical protein